MSRGRARLALAAAGALALAAAAGAAEMAAAQPGAPGPRLPADHVATPPQMLTAPLPADASPEVRRGRELAIIGDCAACHTPEGRPPFSGGRGLNTPFGVIYSANLTGDPQSGVGGWTREQFWRAMHEGEGAHGENLYPAFPYPWFTGVTREDSDALLAYLKTVPAVHATPPANRLPFPLNLRVMLKGWNLLFFKPAAWRPQPARSAEWNRGSYLVDTLGHCGACHTPKNLLGADKRGRYLQGGALDRWYAYDLSGQPRYGLGAWSEADIVEFLKTGRNARANVAGSMAEVISDSTSLMSDADLRAVAVYLKSLPASPAGEPTAPEAAQMRAGEAVYFDSCSACHLEGGKGEPGFFPRLAGHSGAQSPDANNLVRVILMGARTAPTPTRPTPLSMPSYAWKLSDQEVADVSTYVRNSWGNHAAAVDAAQVAKLRRALHPDELRTR